ncbi:MAG: flagellar hook capping FlgD N-terminal domain-containing protein [Caldimonas sp.]
MAVSSTTSATDATAAASSLTASTSDAKATSERFLKLLVAQMQNQDPLSPMDNAQVTSQMAQINTVSGIEKLNLTVQGLSSQFAQLQAVQGVSLVGHDVVVPGNTLQVADDATAQAGYELANPADQVKVEVLAPSGKVIDTLNLGAQTSGVHSFDWQAGANASITGLRFRVTATSGSVNTAATTLVRDKVAAVSTVNSVFSLELVNAGTVPYSSIKAFN